MKTTGAFTLDKKKREAKVCNLCIAQNRPTIHQQFCLSEVKQPITKLATG